MNSLKSLFSQVRKLKEQVPPKRETRDFYYHLFTEQEQDQARAFMDSLPVNIMLKMDLSKLTDEQIHTLGSWLRLEDALQRGDVAQATRMRKHLTFSLEQLVDTFVNLDLSSLPASSNGPSITACSRITAPGAVNSSLPASSNGPSITAEDGITYSFSRTHHRFICMAIKMGRARSYRDDMFRWIEYFV